MGKCHNTQLVHQKRVAITRSIRGMQRLVGKGMVRQHYLLHANEEEG